MKNKNRFRQVEEDIKKVIAGCPPNYKKADIIATVARKIRIKKDTVKEILKDT